MTVSTDTGASTDTAGHDAAVAEAFGMTTGPGQGPDDQQGDNSEHESTEGQDPEDDDESGDVPFERLPESWQKEIQRLRREAAAKRVQTKAPKPQAKVDEQAVEAAREEARAEARMEYGARLAAARIEAALTGLVPNPTDVVDDLNLSKYVTDEGEVDTDAVTILRNRYARIAGRRGGAPGHGRQGSGTGKTSTADQFADALKGLF